MCGGRLVVEEEDEKVVYGYISEESEESLESDNRKRQTYQDIES